MWYTVCGGGTLSSSGPFLAPLLTLRFLVSFPSDLPWTIASFALVAVCLLTI